MTLAQLRYLVAIVDSGLNITLAASRVHSSQSGLSRQIKQLEDELGFRIFVRKGRSLDSLTASGREILPRARRILDEALNIHAFAANRRHDVSGSLLLLTTHTQARYVLAPVIPQIRRAYPQVEMRVELATDANVFDSLAHGEADLLVVSTGGEVPSSGVAIPLFRWQRRVLVPIGHPMALRGTAPSLTELAAEPLITYESALRPISSFKRSFADQGLAPSLAMTARDADLIKTYVRAGMGVGIIAEMAITPKDLEDLASLPTPDELPGCVTWAVLPTTRVLRRYTEDLLLAIAPGINRLDVRRVLKRDQEPNWPEPPAWPVVAKLQESAALV